MDSPRWLRWTAGAGFAILFFAAVWFRVSGLDAIPAHNADESHLGIQVARMLSGKPFTLFTVNGNLMNPFFLAAQVPLQLVFKPSLWVLRAPAAVSGILAILLTYTLGRRSFGRSAGLIAAAIMAGLPLAIVYSRIGHEYCMIPLSGVIVIACAARARPIGLILALGISLLVHPINVFLLPVVLPVILTRLWQATTGRPGRRKALLLAVTAGSAAFLALASWVLLKKPVVREFLGQRPPLDWLELARGLEACLLFRFRPLADWTASLENWLFVGLIFVSLDLGCRRLVRHRQWDQLALLAGTLLSLAAFHILAGPRQFGDFGAHRYGVVFLVPVVFSVACLLQVILKSAPTSAGSEHLPTSSRFVALGLGCLLLVATKVNWLDHQMSGKESLWTFQADVKEPYEQALQVILRDASRSGPRRPLKVVGQEYWDTGPIDFLSARMPRLQVSQLVTLEDIYLQLTGKENRFQVRKREVQGALKDGGYVVSRPGRPAEHGGAVVEEAIREAFEPSQVKRWDIPDAQGNPVCFVYKMRAPESLSIKEPAQERTVEAGAEETRLR